MRTPNGKTARYGRCYQPTPTATPSHNAHVIEESEDGVRTEQAQPKSEPYQAIVVLPREAIQYSEHGFSNCARAPQAYGTAWGRCCLVAAGSSEAARGILGQRSSVPRTVRARTNFCVCQRW